VLGLLNGEPRPPPHKPQRAGLFLKATASAGPPSIPGAFCLPSHGPRFNSPPATGRICSHSGGADPHHTHALGFASAAAADAKQKKASLTTGTIRGLYKPYLGHKNIQQHQNVRPFALRPPRATDTALASPSTSSLEGMGISSRTLKWVSSDRYRVKASKL
jgi:hypothetical protein